MSLPRRLPDSSSLFQPILVLFSSATSLNTFEATIDNSSLGLPGQTLSFFDAQNHLLKEVPFDQTVPGLRLSSGPVDNVSFALLPAGKFYDDFKIDAVPEPSTVALAALGGLMVTGRGLRKTRPVTKGR